MNSWTIVDKVILVTGSTDGIGKAAALQLAQLGARVLIHGRSSEKVEAVLLEIRRKTGSEKLDSFTADLASQDKVRDLADEILEHYDRLDVLVNNAGVYMEERVLTQDGMEMTFAVNHLAPFLLTHLFLDRLLASAPARIITVSSTTHQSAHVDFDNLQGEKSYNGYQAYALSKLGNILFTYELAERLEDTGVTVNCLHPGAVSTKLLHAGFGAGGKSPQEGAETVVYLASAAELEGVTGKYFVNKQPVRTSPVSYDSSLRKRFWEISEELVGVR